VSVERERQALKHLSHESIVKYFGCCSADDAVFIFLEYIPGGNLREFIDKNGAFSENVTKSFTKQILEAVNNLHQNNYFHRDIKSDNILICNEEKIKLADFGLTKFYQGEMSNTSVGTPRFRAPEMVKGTKYDKAVDVCGRKPTPVI
ncbi:hypothetical protein Btru_040971, partial [Bulinus truncatus]